MILYPEGRKTLAGDEQARIRVANPSRSGLSRRAFGTA